ncbi:MAG: type I secretion protein, partial [Alphaproteobacteria bacterium]
SWIGRQHFATASLRARPPLRPVRIRAGALGNNLPERDLVVSPQHRMLLATPRAQLLYGEPEVLAAANALVGRPGIERLAPAEVDYVHIMFERHELVLANGAWSESFQPGDWSLGTVGAAQREEILAIFPELAAARQNPQRPPMPAARPSLKTREVQALAW